MFISSGNSIHTIRWINSLSLRGNEIHLVFMRDHFPDKNKKIENSIIMHPMKYKSGIGYYLAANELKKIYYDIKPDIVNVHYASGYGTLTRLSNIPYILSFWGSDIYEYPEKNLFNLMTIKLNIKKSLAVASTSQCMADQIKLISNTKKNITITPFGVDEKVFLPLCTRKDKHTIVFGIVKSLEIIYGIDILLKAFKLFLNYIKTENMDTSPLLLIYGTGTQQRNLINLSKELGIEKNIKFCGYVPNEQIPIELSKIDIFCLTSFYESFGVSAIEAMSCGLPVIASDAKGFKEIIENGVNGYIVPKKNEKALFEKMKELYISPSLRNKIGKNARLRILERYTWDKSLDIMEELYRREI